MTENIIIPQGVAKNEIYRSLLPQIHALVEGEKNVIANLANISAALKEAFDFFWVGFYLVQQEANISTLVVGPYQGPLACSRIGFGKGVCGTSWQQMKTIIVPDVDKFPGHIACSNLSKSEIVVPIVRDKKVIGVLDVDSTQLNDFDETDATYLEAICQLVATLL